MENLNMNTPNLEDLGDNSLKEQIVLYIKNWKWFVLSVIIALFISFIYLRYTTPIYLSTASILVKDNNNNGGLSEAALLNELGSGGSSYVIVDNEIAILLSKRIMGAVVDDLNLTTQYFVEGNIKALEAYNSQPFNFKFIGEDSLYQQKRSISLNIIPKSETRFAIKQEKEEDYKEFDFGEIIDLNFGKFVIVPNLELGSSPISKHIDKTYIVKVLSRFSTISRYQNYLDVQPNSSRSSVLKLSMSGPNRKKSEDILNNLIVQFNNDAINDKNLISQNTSVFIAERLDIIAQELDSVETNKQNFKTTNNLTDITSEAQLYIQEDRAVQKQRVEIETQLELVKQVISYLQGNSRSSDLLPTNLGIADGGLSIAINQYNQLVIERDKQLQFGTELNPVVVTLNNQIRELRATILESLRNNQRSLTLKRNDIRNEQNRVDSRISSVPKQEKTFRDITRQQNIKEELYLFLLRKREETAISLAITAPVAKVIDDAYTTGKVSPKPNIIYLSAILIGLIIPFLIIYISNLLDTKIHNKADVEKILTAIPILGEVPKIDSKDNETIKSNDRSVLAEAFRILRTNLGYFVKTLKGDKNNVIFVTSTVKGEGKTFVAFNLALTLSSSDKRILLIGADIRNPQVHRYLDVSEQSKGLSEFLYDEKVTTEKIINSYTINNNQLDVLLSGRIPPNPAELLMRPRFKELIDSVKDQYDFIIVDTAPTMLVTDTLLISQYADFTVYVSRAEYTDKKLLRFPEELHNESKLKNMAIVVNDVSISNYGYGNKYGYGYSYGVEKETFTKRMKTRLGL